MQPFKIFNAEHEFPSGSKDFRAGHCRGRCAYIYLEHQLGQHHDLPGFIAQSPLVFSR
jgi:hypothetical protein